MQKKELIKLLTKHNFNKNIIKAFSRVDRKSFLPKHLKELAYFNSSLPIGFGQTISQPFTIAFMLQFLDPKPRQKIMEIGSGSGYVLALLNELTSGAKIYGVEKISALLERSRHILRNYDNIQIFPATKKLGLEKLAPFDRILISAAASKFPQKLADQLTDDGILVCPVKQSIVVTQKQNNRLSTKVFFGFSFVPLIED